MNFNLDSNWMTASKGSLNISGSTGSGDNSNQKQVSASDDGSNQKQIPPPSEPSGVSAEQLEEKLTTAFEAERVHVVDMSGGCGQSFEAVIVSTQFNKKTLLQRHRMVNSAIKDEVAAIHAWTPKCFTPEEFERKAGELQQQQQGGSVEGEKQRDGTMTTNWHTQSVSASESKGSVTEPVDGPSGVLDSVKKKIVG